MKGKPTADAKPAGTSPTQRLIRVFISSTFRDMHLEREELVKFVFPRLRKLCEERRVAWSEVDLRWGITDEQKAEFQVLPICLAEIDRCRPYFIGILGERYGWVPDDLPPELLDKQAWLAAQRGHSVTELEILYGVLNNPAMAGHGLFYFRDPAYIESLPQSERPEFTEQATAQEIRRYGRDEARRRAGDRAKKLEALKNRIRRSGFPVRDNYKNPKELGKLVFDDFAAVINRLFPREKIPETLDQESAEHEAFAEVRRRVYVGRSEYFRRLDEHAAGNAPPLVILGESGSGKSALLSNWSHRFRAGHPGWPVIAHFIGSTPQSTDWWALVRRIIGEINRFLGREREPPLAREDLRAEFADALERAANKGRVILVIDALNQLEDKDQAQELAWLPQEIPQNIRVVLTTLPGRPLAELNSRGWPAMTIQLLDVSERKRMLMDYLALFRKGLSPGQLERIVTAPQSSNPLYLQALAEELRVFGVHERLDSLIEHYLEARTPAELFTRILKRYEGDYEQERPGLVGDAVRLLWAARRGLYEGELLDLIGSGGAALPMASWSPLYLAAENHLVNRSGLLGFSHDYLRQAVEDLYLPTEDDRKRAHLELADYFQARDNPYRKLDELPWQLDRAASWKRLYDVLSDLAFVNEGLKYNAYDIREYWTDIHDHSDLRMLDAYGDVIANPDRHHEFVWTIAWLLNKMDYVSEAAPLLEYVVAECRKAEGEKGRLRLAQALHDYSAVLFLNREYEKTLDLEREAESIFRQLEARDGLGRSLQRQGDAYKALKQYEKALALYMEAEHFSEQSGDRFGQASSWTSQGDIHLLLRRLDEALALFEKARSVMRQRGEIDSLQGILDSQAIILSRKGDLEGALSLQKENEQVCRKYGLRREMVISLREQAIIHSHKGEPDAVIDCCSRALALNQELKEPEKSLFLWRLLGEALIQKGDYEKALASFREAELFCRERGDEKTLEAVLDNQAWILNRLKRPEEALAKYREGESLLFRNQDWKQLAMNIYSQGIILLNVKRTGEALKLFKESAGLSRRSRDERLLADCLDQQAYIARLTGKLGAGLALSQKSESLFRKLGVKDGLMRSLGEQAIILKGLDRFTDALARLREQETFCREASDKASLFDCLYRQASLLGEYLNTPQEALPFAEEARAVGRELGWPESHSGVDKLIENVRAKLAAG